MHERINILHVTRAVEGGMLAHIVKLCRDYNHQKFRVFIAAADTDVFLKSLGQDATVIQCQLAAQINIFSDIKAVIKLVAIIKNNNIQIVHTHGYKAGLVGRIAALLAQVPIIIATFHNFIYDRSIKALPKRIIIVIQKLLAARTDHIIAVSEALARDLISNEKINPQKISTVYFNVEIAKLPDSQLLKYKNQISNDFVNIVTAARLTKEKGIHIFIKMAAAIAEKYPHVRFHIIGEGPEKNKLRELCSTLKVEHLVSFWGYIKNAAALFPYFDIIVIPSLSEGLSITAIEALYAKKAVVASNAGGLPEVIKDNQTGLLFGKADATDCAQKIERLLNDPELAARLAAEGYKSADSWVNSAQFCQETEKIYLSYLQKKVGY